MDSKRNVERLIFLGIIVVKKIKKYKILLIKELHYCNINREKIKKMANEDMLILYINKKLEIIIKNIV